METLKRDVLRTLLYYDIWNYPLTLEELEAFLPCPVTSHEFLASAVHSLVASGAIASSGNYYFASHRPASIVEFRTAAARRARFMWIAARAATHIIKRCPFVRAVFVSGELSKHVSSPGGDVDFLILTEPGRLWIVRSILTAFKKTVLFNQKKFFCLNFFVSTDSLALEEHNVYLATEVATLRPLFGTAWFTAYLEANSWVNTFFPNFRPGCTPMPIPNNRQSILQAFAERVASFFDLDKLDTRILIMMQQIWRRRYPDLDESVRDNIFRSTKKESRAYVGNFESTILSLYEQKLKTCGVAD